jgi:hypothetical protein
MRVQRSLALLQSKNAASHRPHFLDVVEKIGTKQGWAPIAPDADFITGLPREIEAFYRAAVAPSRQQAIPPRPPPFAHLACNMCGRKPVHAKG